MSREKILIVDDEPDITKTICIGLESEGYEVLTAMDGKEALEKVRDESPDLIVLDIMLPGMNGDEVALKLREKEEYKHIPIILITALVQQCDEESISNMKVDFCLKKPFELDELSKKIRELLNSYKIDLDDRKKLQFLGTLLNGKVIILGVGNTLLSDDGAGSILASRIKNKLPYQVYEAGPSPENYLEKIVKEKPDTLLIIDAVDFSGKPGEINILEAKDIQTVNLFSTHNASITLSIKYLQNNFKVDIIILAIQPKSVSFGDNLSPEITQALSKLENWFFCFANNIKY